MIQVGVGVADEAGFAGESQQGLYHRESDQFRVGQPGLQADDRSPWCQVGVLPQEIIGSDVECGREGV
ncbi:hypothetical protein GCM10029964_042340 [Kibdelosporangium lantanae]